MSGQKAFPAISLLLGSDKTYTLPTVNAPAIGTALVDNGPHPTQANTRVFDWTARPVMLEPAVAPALGTDYRAADGTWRPIPPAVTPGGSSGQLQYNNGGAFAGLAGSAVSGSNLTIGGTVQANQYNFSGGFANLREIISNWPHLTANFNKSITYRASTGWDDLTLGNGTAISWVSTGDTSSGTPDAKIVRNTTGPAVQVQAAGGLNVKNLAGSADGPFSASNITSSGILALTSTTATRNIIQWKDDGAGDWIIASGGVASTDGFRITKQGVADIAAFRPSQSVIYTPWIVSGGTVTASTPALNVSQTWNNAAVAFTGIKANFTDTTSLTTSLPVDVQVNSSSIFSVRKDGQISVTNPSNSYQSNILSVTNTGNIGLGYHAGAGGYNLFLSLYNGSGLGVSQNGISSTRLGLGTSVWNNVDIYLARASSGVAELNSGTTGDYRDLKLRTLYGTSDLFASATGSTASSPRTIGINDFTASPQAGRFQFGDALNSLQCAFGGPIELQSYWGVNIHGDRQNATALTATTTNIIGASLGVFVGRTASKGIAVRQIASQTGNPFEIQRSDGTANVYFKATGGFTFDGASILPASGNNYVRPSLGLDLGFDGTNSYHVLSLWGSSASWQVSIHGNFGTHMGNRYGDFVISSSGHGIRNQASNHGGHLILEFPEVATTAKTFKIRRTNYTTATDIMTIDNTSKMTYAGNMEITGSAVFSSTVTSAFQTLSSDPTVSDIPAGSHRLVKNTGVGEIRDWVNDGGVMKKSAAYT